MTPGAGVVKLPRVTEILEAAGLSPDYSGVPPAILDRAAKRGTAVHAAIAEHAAGTLWGVEPHVKPYLDAYERFVHESGYQPIESPKEFLNPEFPSEMEIAHPDWNYIGHIDPCGIGWRGGERWLLDWKCVAQMSPKVAYQLAGYRILWNRVRPDQLIARSAAIQLKPDGTYRLYDPEAQRHPIPAAEAEHVFLSALVIFHARARHTRSKS